MRCAELVHVHPELGIAAAEHARGPRVIEVDVGQEQRPRLGGAEAVDQGFHRGRRTRIHDHSVDLVGADHPVAPEVQHVNWAAHRGQDHTISGVSEHRLPERDGPWVMRTYAGHSTAKESNELYRRNLAKGQTGLSVAFDLPTQTGYDPDHELSRGEVGKVGVPIPHLGAMRQLFHDIPLDEINTSMTINATAMWLLAMYQVVAEEQGVDPAALSGTTQNDIIKEYLSRGTYVFGPAPSLRLTTDMIAYTVSAMPKWNPLNICSYHLQEAGATPTQ